MKRTFILTLVLISLCLACSTVGFSPFPTEGLSQDNPPPKSEKRCGDKVCDGPENETNCPQDCTAESSQGNETAPSQDANQSNNQSPKIEADYSILYQISENTLTSFDMGDNTCNSLNFGHYLDGGLTNPDGSANQILYLRENPTSSVTSKLYDQYYYVSTSNNPVTMAFGLEIFDWDVAGQNLWSAAFANNQAEVFVANSNDKFPGGVTTSPGNTYVLYPMTKPSLGNQGGNPVVLSGSINPFSTDSSLNIARGKSDQKSVLTDSYNRQLFSSFADFSPDGRSFYTIARHVDSFEFVKISLDSRVLMSFSEIFPSFDWNQINWDEFFPQANDFAFGSFTISPDEKRLIGYKSIFTANPENPCLTEASHNLWVFNLETNSLDSFRNRQGYITDSSWKNDSTEIAFSFIDNAGCYPENLHSRIDLYDRDGQLKINLVSEAQSKITNIGWSPDGSNIAYDVYSLDLIGRIKLITLENNQVSEAINTQMLGYQLNETKPITLLFTDWVKK